MPEKYNVKDYVFDCVYQYFDTHNSMSKEKFFVFWEAIDIINKKEEEKE